MTTERETDQPAGLAPIHVVLPIRSVSGGKARLGGALDAEEREELVLGMLLHTLDVLSRWQVCRRIHLISPDPVMDVVTAQAEIDLTVHRQSSEGLNAAIDLGAEVALAEGATSMLVLPGDLPHLSVEALDGLAMAADAGVAAAAGGSLVAIAPSDARSGTNALLLRPPDVITPAFGADSFEAHLRAAAAVDAAVQVVSDPALSFDLDTPDDLERLDSVRLRELMALGRATAEEVSA
jgi:2-phospho-L-lactate guanylyltransferase